MVIEHVAKARAAQLEKEKQDTIDRESAKYDHGDIILDHF